MTRDCLLMVAGLMVSIWPFTLQTCPGVVNVFWKGIILNSDIVVWVTATLKNVAVTCQCWVLFLIGSLQVIVWPTSIRPNRLLSQIESYDKVVGILYVLISICCGYTYTMAVSSMWTCWSHCKINRLVGFVRCATR